MQEYKVKVKDHRQNTTHTVSQLAESQQAANSIVLAYLYKAFDHYEFEIK